MLDSCRDRKQKQWLLRAPTNAAKREESPCQPGAVHTWHETDMPKYLGDVRCWVNSGNHMLSLSFSGFDPLQACPIMSGQGSRSQPGEKLRLLCCEFFRRENAFLVQFGQPLDFGEEVRFLGTVGPMRLAGGRHPWFRSLGLHAVYRGDRQS